MSGLRLGLFNQVILQHENFDGATQTYQTTQDDILDLFVLVKNVLAQMDQNSDFPMSAKAIYEYLTTQLALYRLKSVDIEMSEVAGLIQHLTSYRLKTDEVFVNLVTDTLAYDNGTVDLKTKMDGTNSKIHALAAGLAGSDILQSEQSLSSWITTHARDQVLDSLFKASKFHQIRTHAA